MCFIVCTRITLRRRRRAANKPHNIPERRFIYRVYTISPRRRVGKSYSPGRDELPNPLYNTKILTAYTTPPAVLYRSGCGRRHHERLTGPVYTVPRTTLLVCASHV